MDTSAGGIRGSVGKETALWQDNHEKQKEKEKEENEEGKKNL